MEMKTPWDEIDKRTEYIWTHCNKCRWNGFIVKPDRDEPCPQCGVFDLKQRFIIVKIHCKDCGEIEYARQGKLECGKCKSKRVNVVRKIKVLRTVFGELNNDKKIKPAGFKSWPKDKKGNLIC